MDYIAIIIFVFGTFIGSFFNVVIYRLPLKKSIVYGSSSCPNCNTAIKPYDLIPVLSYFVLKGQCRNCQHKISIRYPLIEILTGTLYLLTYLQFRISPQFLIGILFISILIIIAMIDIDTMEIFDRFHIMILVLAIISIYFNGLSIPTHIIGFFIISVPFFFIAWLTGGIGGGDIKLIAVGGLLLGYPSTLVAFMIAALSGGIVAILLITLKQKSRKSLMAFGPYLCLGLTIAYIYGPQIISWYLNLFNLSI